MMAIPGSKSHTIRAALLATLAEGTWVIRNHLLSDDCKAALRAVRQFGAQVEERENEWRITPPEDRLHLPDDILNVDNSGTTMMYNS